MIFSDFNYLEILGIILALYLLRRTYQIISHCLVYFRPASFDFNYHADGGYALITGGAGGIGKKVAEEFAVRGINLFLIDFNSKLLEETRKELERKYPHVLVKTKSMDLTTLTQPKILAEFEESISNIKIGILFNCAGIAEYKLLNFTENTHKEINSICTINATVPTILCKLILPQMLSRHRGLVLGMGSAAGKSPCAILPIYGATKSFMIQLSMSLRNCYPTSETGVEFHVLYPHFVKSPMTLEGPVTPGDLIKFGKKILFPEVDAWVKSALKTVGQTGGGSPGWFWFEPAVKYQRELENLADLADGSKAEQRIKWRNKYEKNISKTNLKNGKQK